jgi:hypothetical protein
MSKTYIFNVRCYYEYEIDADSEDRARQILAEKGGIDIDGTLLTDDDAYENADLVETEEK